MVRRLEYKERLKPFFFVRPKVLTTGNSVGGIPPRNTRLETILDSAGEFNISRVDTELIF
jgi:hypothetical protein